MGILEEQKQVDLCEVGVQKDASESERALSFVLHLFDCFSKRTHEAMQLENVSSSVPPGEKKYLFLATNSSARSPFVPPFSSFASRCEPSPLEMQMNTIIG